MNAQSNGAPSLPEFVPVIIIVGAGPAGITAATLLAQYGIECLVLDRHETAYPLPRAVHADDEIYRILARLGVSDEFAAHARPVLFGCSTPTCGCWPRSSAAPSPAPRLPADEHVRPTRVGSNAARQPQDIPARRNSGQCRGHRRHPDPARPGPGELPDRVRGGEHSVQASYVLGCDGANSAVRAGIGAHMYGLPFQQTWVVIDVDTDAELNQWEAATNCPQRAGTYMRVGPTRHRWEFRLLDETAADYQTIAAIEPLIAPWLGTPPPSNCAWSASPHTPSARRWPTAGATAMCSSWVTPPTSPRPSSGRAWQPGCATR